MHAFTHEHMFAAPSVLAVFTAYFDPRHVADHDRALDIATREVLEHADAEAELRRVCRVVPRRQLPAIVRPLFESPLHYVETAIWRKAADVIELAISPSFARGRTQITASYRLFPLAPGRVRRVYEAAVSVDVPVFAPRVERAIVAEFERSTALAAACTQAFLDREAASGKART